MADVEGSTTIDRSSPEAPASSRPRRPATPKQATLDPALADSPLCGAVRAIAELEDEWARFGCPHCGKRNKCRVALRGHVVGCSRCRQSMTVPPAHDMPGADVPVVKASSATALPPVPAALISPSASRQPKRAWPWWLIAAHASLPIGTVLTLVYLKTHGYLPGLQIGF